MSDAFQRVMGRQPTTLRGGTLPLNLKSALDVGALPHFWYPDRDGVEDVSAVDKAFARRLHDTSADLRMVRPPAGAPIPGRPWLMWYRKSAITYHLCPGWSLLFVWREANGTPLPLDDRIFANLYRISAAAFGDAEAYFDSIVKKLKDDKQRSKDQDKANTDAKRREMMASRRISTAGKGNKFALHHDGTIVPSRSEQNWVRENAARSMPGEMAKAARERRERRGAR